MSLREFYKMRPKQDEDTELIKLLDALIENRKLSEVLRAMAYEWFDLESPNEVIEAIRKANRAQRVANIKQRGLGYHKE